MSISTFLLLLLLLLLLFIWEFRKIWRSVLLFKCLREDNWFWFVRISSWRWVNRMRLICWFSRTSEHYSFLLVYHFHILILIPVSNRHSFRRENWSLLLKRWEVGIRISPLQLYRILFIVFGYLIKLNQSWLVKRCGHLALILLIKLIQWTIIRDFIYINIIFFILFLLLLFILLLFLVFLRSHKFKIKIVL